MSDKSIVRASYSSQIEIEVEAKPAIHTRYGGILAYERAWKRFGSDQLLHEVGIKYGQEENIGPELTFALSTGPLIEARSARQVAQRYGGEPSELEADELVSHLLPIRFSQRQLSRFTSQERHDWEGLNWGRIYALQRLAETKMEPGGVLILDDFTLAKPYAREMEGVGPVWDNCLKRKVNGYLVVHLYYYHPNRPSYPLVLTPWQKSSATGEKKVKSARRRATVDEELSRLDLGLQAIEAVKARQLPFEAVVFDSWYTVRWLSHELTQLDIPWIGEVSASQKLIVAGEKLTVAQIWERYADRMTPLWGIKSGLKAYAIDAINPADAYTKVDQPVRLILTEGLHAPRDKDQGRHLLISNQQDWSTYRLVRLFSYRPQIEPRHRLGKQEQGWLDFHTQTLAALQAHLAISLLRDTLLHLLRLWAPGLAHYSFGQMIRHWIGYIADLTVVAAGKLKIHLGRDHPALSFILWPDPPPVSLLSYSVVN